MKRCWRRVLSAVLALAMVCGVSSGNVFGEEGIAPSAVYGTSITLQPGEKTEITVDGDYTSTDLSTVNTSVATVELAATSTYTDKTPTADGGTYVAGYKYSGLYYFLIFSYSSGLSIDTTNTYSEGTELTFSTNSYLSFTQDGTTYYLNKSGTSLAASTTASTTWSYSEDEGFYCTENSTNYSLGGLASSPSVYVAGTYGTTGTYGTFTFSANYEGTTYYLNISYDSDEDSWTTSLVTDADEATEITYAGTYLCITVDSTVYYLTITSDSTTGGYTFSPDASSSVWWWNYDAEYGFYCVKSSVYYYLTLTTVTTTDSETSESTTTPAFTMITSTPTSSTTLMNENIVTAPTGYLGYTLAGNTWYLSLSGSGDDVAYSSVTSTSSATALSMTADGYFTYTADSTAHYLSRNSSTGKASFSTYTSNALQYSYYPADITTYRNTGSDYYLDTIVIEGYAVTESAATSITFTGVAAGTTTVTIGGTTYTITVVDNSDYVTMDTSPFLTGSSSTYTVSGTTYSMSDKTLTALYLSAGLSYTINLDTNIVNTGGTWTIASSSAATITNGTADSNGTMSFTDTDGTVTITGVAAGVTTLTYTVDGTSYVLPVTIVDYCGTDTDEDTTYRTYEFNITEVTDTTAYMGILYGTSSGFSMDYTEIVEGETVYIRVLRAYASAVDYFGSPDEGYALTYLSSTNSAGDYMALDSDDPGETEFITYINSSGSPGAGYTQVYYMGADVMFDLVQAALDTDCDGAMGFTRTANASNVAYVSEVAVRSQQLPTVTKEITSVKRNGVTREYTEGMAIQIGDVVYYTITVTQYATTETITYSDVKLTDTMSVTHYLAYSYDSGTGTLNVEATTDYDSASVLTYTESGYLTFTQSGTTYYLYVDSNGSLSAATDQTSACVWTYDAASTGFSCSVTTDDGTVTYYLSETTISTETPTANTIVTAYTDEAEETSELSAGGSYVLGYQDASDRTAYFSSTLTNTKTIELTDDTLESDTTYTYTVYYTVTEDDEEETLTNTVTLSYTYTAEYSSGSYGGTAEAAASLTISQDELSVSKDVDTEYYASMTSVTSLSFSDLELVSDSTVEYQALTGYYYPDSTATDGTANYWPVYYAVSGEADSSDSTTTVYTAVFYYTTDGGTSYIALDGSLSMTAVRDTDANTVTLTQTAGDGVTLYSAGDTASYTGYSFTYTSLFGQNEDTVEEETELYGCYYQVGTSCYPVYYTISSTANETSDGSTSTTYTATLYYTTDSGTTYTTISDKLTATKITSGTTTTWYNTAAADAISDEASDVTVTLYKQTYTSTTYSSFTDLNLMPGYVRLADYYYGVTSTDVTGSSTTVYYPVYFKMSVSGTTYTVTLYYFTEGTTESDAKTIGSVTATASTSDDGTVTLKDATSLSSVTGLYISTDTEITDASVQAALANIDFVFTLYKYDTSNKKYVAVTGENYAVYEGDDFVKTGITDENGNFTLQDGQTARFYDVDLNADNTSYYVVEDLSYLKADNWITVVTEETNAEGASITLTELSDTDLSKYRASDTVTLSGNDATSETISYDFYNQYVEFDPPYLDLTGDEIVLDYGLSVDVGMAENDIIAYSSDDYTLNIELFSSAPTDSDTSTKTSVTGTYGTASYSGNGTDSSPYKITYELTKDLTGIETIYYRVTLTSKSDSTSTVTDTAELEIMPATQMYYEEDFGSTVQESSSATAHSLIQYSGEVSGSSSATWSTVYNTYTYTNTTTTLNKSDASESEKDTSTTSYAFTQEEGRVGDTENSVYGADEAYSEDLYDSENHAKKVDVSSAPAAFRYYFTGSGTTIYGRTSEDTAYISVTITYEGSESVDCPDPEDSTKTKTVSSGGEYYTWYIDTRNVSKTSETSSTAIYEDTLYNIPVFNVSDLPYGKWKVYVYVYKAGTEVNYIYKTTATNCYSTGYYAYVKSYTDLDGKTKSSGYQEIYTDGTNLYIKSQANDYAGYGILLTFGSSGTVTEDDTTKYRVYEYNDGTYTETKVAESVLTSTITSTNSKVSTVVTALYLPVKDSNKSGKYFYLDGVRIYNPAGTSSDDNSAYTDCAAAYASDGEANAVTLTLRDKLVNNMYSDESGDQSDSFATLTDIDGNLTDTSSYADIGPNHELYLDSTTASENDSSSWTSGNTLSFYLLNWDADAYKIFVGMKSPDGTAAKVTVGDEEIKITNSTDQYYDISSYITYEAISDDEDSSYAAKVTISSTSGLVSLTNLKITGTNNYATAYNTATAGSSSALSGSQLVLASSTLFEDIGESSSETVSVTDAAGTAEATAETDDDTSDTGTDGAETDSDADSTDTPSTQGSSSTESDGTKSTVRKKQKITVKKASLKKTIRYKKLKKKKRTFKIKASAKGGAKLTFKKLSGNKKIKVSKKGKVTIKKGLKRGTYKVKVRISAARTSKYKKASVTKTITIKIK